MLFDPADNQRPVLIVDKVPGLLVMIVYGSPEEFEAVAGIMFLAVEEAITFHSATMAQS